MKKQLVLLCVALLLAATPVRPEDVQEESEGALILTSDNFYGTVKNNDVLVKFYAPWCSHCKRLAPVWNEAADKTRGKILVAKVDCTSYSGICDRYEVKGYPTIKFFRDGEPRDFKGRRSLDGVTSYADKMVAPAVNTVKPSEVATMLTEPSKVRFVLFYKKEGPVRDSFWAAARKWQGGSIGFFESDKPNVAEKLGVSKDETSLCVVKDGKSVKYDGDFTVESLNVWVGDERNPLMQELNSESFDDAVYGGKLANIALVANPKSKKTEKYLEEVKRVATTLRKKFVTSYINADTKEGKQFATQFDVEAEHLPRVVVLDALKDVHYTQPHSSGTSHDAIVAFLQDVLDDKVEPQGPGASFSAKLYEYYKQHKTAFHMGGAFLTFGFLATLVAACIAIIRADDDEEEETKAKKE